MLEASITLRRARGARLYVLVILACICAHIGLAARAATPFAIEPGQAATVQGRGVRITAIAAPPAASGLIEIAFQAGVEYPNALFEPARGNVWDWGRFGAMVLRLRNASTEAVSFSIRIDDDPETRSGTVHCKTGSAIVPPKTSGAFVLNLSTGGDPMTVHGMRGGPPVAMIPGAVELSGPGSVDAGHITSFQIFMHRPEQDRALALEGIRLVPIQNPAALYDHLVDAFGQYTRADWPGKIHNEHELLAARDAEARDLAANPSLPDRDAYGGWSAGPEFPPTGFFTTRKVDGRWWLVDPDGRLFFSTGIDTVTYHEWGTVVTGREKMFDWLPAEGDPLARFYRPLGHIHSGPVLSGRTFSFYAANLFRKDGDRYAGAWEQRTIARFHSWGFNTLGNWSDERLAHRHGVPYAASLGIGGGHRRVSGGEDYWGLMHDPFDPAFAEDADRSVRWLATRIKGDPWCIGYFVDNELSWGGGPGPEHGRYALAYGTLREGPDSPAKQAFLAQLKTKYGQIELLNKAWGSHFARWDALAASYAPDGASRHAAMREDLAVFVTAFARQYFTVVRDAIRKYDPNHLCLGCRFAYFSPEEARAAAEVCDVVSFNVYEPKLARDRWAFANDLGKPCLIGEFHVGSTDRGMFHPGLVAAPDQRERAAIFKQYVQSVADHPAFVGCHCFDYIDEPLTGRWFDGENYNIGFVTVTDTPYPEMVAAAREVNASVYARRAKSAAH